MTKEESDLYKFPKLQSRLAHLERAMLQKDVLALYGCVLQCIAVLLFWINALEP